MKVGILTLMHGYNYGGMLQCLSLVRALEELGHEVDVIDFHPRLNWRRLRAVAGLFGAGCDAKIVDVASNIKYGRKVHAKFSSFRRNYLNLSKPCNTRRSLRKLMHCYDAMVVGSDQVWNFDWFTPEYFFDFAHDYHGRLISYAACFGHGNQSEVLLKKVGNWLLRFKGISVRNDFSKRSVYTACQRDALIATDPTLLVDLNDLSIRPTLPFKKYILLYALSGKRYTRLIPFFNKLKKQLFLPIVAIKSDTLQGWDMSEMDFIVENPSVEEWLGLFQNAKFVVTDSFHGTLFSMKNRVPFINYIGRDSTFERVAYIAKRYRIQQGFDIAHIRADIATMFNFKSIQDSIRLHIEESKAFLREQIG
jgi:hypothetical protein